ncbi:DUF5710 domain-containing protein [Pectobacterium atrosepticum]|uniref:DUF5710 domain-containing protein n=1 Tax=Pectobacterium atrosepticum TaxID=29471 RepID=UPI003AFA53F5
MKKSHRIWLAVPHEEKDEATNAHPRLGDGQNAIVWDKELRLWYARPGVELNNFDRWLPHPHDLSMNSDDPVSEFAQVLEGAGLVLKGLPIMDGTLQRVPTKQDKKGSQSGVYKGFMDGRPAGWYRNYRSGDQHPTKWTFSGGDKMDPLASLHLRAHAQQTREDNTRELENQYKRQAAYATHYVSRLPQATTNEYLTRKGVLAAPGVRITPKGELVIPFSNAKGDIRSYQRIPPTGGKFARILKDSEKTGNWFAFGTPVNGQPVLFAEGYSTSSSLHESTGLPVLMTVDAGNMIAVAQIARAVWPDSRFIFCADNDHHLKNSKTGEPENKGIICAQKAATLTNGEVIAPGFTPSELERQFTDFNDLDVSRGREIFQHVMNVQLLSIGIQTSFSNEPQIRDALSLDGFVFTPAKETTMEKEASPSTVPVSSQENTSQALVSEARSDSEKAMRMQAAQELVTALREMEFNGQHAGVTGGAEHYQQAQDAEARADAEFAMKRESPISTVPEDPVTVPTTSEDLSAVSTHTPLADDGTAVSSATVTGSDTIATVINDDAPLHYQQIDRLETSPSPASEPWVADSTSATIRDTRSLQEYERDIQREGQQITAETQEIQQDANNLSLSVYGDMRSIGNSVVDLRDLLSNGDISQTRFNRLVNEKVEDFSHSLLSGNYSQADINYTTSILHEIGADKERQSSNSDIVAYSDVRSIGDKLSAMHQQVAIGDMTRKEFDNEFNKLSSEFNRSLLSGQFTIDDFNYTTKIITDINRAEKNDVVPFPSATTSPSESIPTVKNEQSETGSNVHVETKNEELKISASPVADTTEKPIPEVSETLSTPDLQATVAIDTEIPPPSPEGVISEIGVTETNRTADLFKQTTPNAGEDKENEAPDLTLKSTAQEKPNVSTNPPEVETDAIVYGPRRPDALQKEDLEKIIKALTSEALSNNKVLYRLDAEDAFHDLGNRLEMCNGASQDDRKVLAALAVAAKFYGGVIELTGSSEFKEKAMRLIIEHDLDIRMKLPAQRAQFEELRKQIGTIQDAVVTHMPTPDLNRNTPFNEKEKIPEAKPSAGHVEPVTQTGATVIPQPQIPPAPMGSYPDAPLPPPIIAEPSQPVSSVPADTPVPGTPAMASSDAIQVSKAPEEPAPTTLSPGESVTAVLMNYGEAMYENKEQRGNSFFIELQNRGGSHTYWGQDLRKLVENHKAGDMVTLTLNSRDTWSFPNEEKERVKNNWSLGAASTGIAVSHSRPEQGQQLLSFPIDTFSKLTQKIRQAWPDHMSGLTLPPRFEDRQFYLGEDRHPVMSPQGAISSIPPSHDAPVALTPVMASVDHQTNRMDLLLVQSAGQHLQGVVRLNDTLYPALATPTADNQQLVISAITDTGPRFAGYGQAVNFEPDGTTRTAPQLMTFHLKGREEEVLLPAKLYTPEKQDDALFQRLGFEQTWKQWDDARKPEDRQEKVLHQERSHSPGR